MTHLKSLGFEVYFTCRPARVTGARWWTESRPGILRTSYQMKSLATRRLAWSLST